MFELRNAPLQTVNESSIRARNKENNEIRESVKERILKNSAITDAKVKFNQKLAAFAKRLSKDELTSSTNLLKKGSVFFNNGKYPGKKTTIPVAPNLSTLKRAEERQMSVYLKKAQDKEERKTILTRAWSSARSLRETKDDSD